MLDVVVGDLTAAVEPLVDDDGFLAGLREEVAFEVLIAGPRCVRHVDVGDAALGPFVNLVEIALDPGTVAERGLVGDRLDHDVATSRAVGVGADLELDPLAGGALERAVDLAVGLDLLAVDRKQEVAGLDVDAGRRQRRAEVRVPVSAAVDRLEAESAVRDLVVGAEQADGHRLGLVEPLAAAQEAVADGELAEHHPDHAVQVVPRGQVRKELFILVPDGIPVGTVHVRRVEVVAVDPPGFAEDLGPFGAGLDPHRDRRERQCAIALRELAQRPRFRA